MNAEILEDMGYEDFLVMDGFDDAIIGITTDNCVVYDYDKMVECFCKENNCTEIDAVDWIGYNTLRALDYIPKTERPVIMYGLEK